MLEKHFTNREPGVEWAKIVSKINKTLFEFVAKQNFDERVIWSFLTLIERISLAKKELWALLALGPHP